MPIDLDEIIKALAHPVRRDILVWLKDPLTCFPDQTSVQGFRSPRCPRIWRRCNVRG